jgi:hypothetical protein
MAKSYFRQVREGVYVLNDDMSKELIKLNSELFSNRKGNSNKRKH